MVINWWNKREKREKTLLSVMVAAFFLFISYEVIDHLPASTPSVQLNLAQQQQELKTASLLVNQITALRARGAVPFHPASAALIKQSLASSGLQSFVTESHINNKTAQITFKSVPFDQLATWLSTLTQGSPIKIKHWSSTRLKNDGLVSAAIKLSI